MNLKTSGRKRQKLFSGIKSGIGYLTLHKPRSIAGLPEVY
jgi:hypothetical protein